MFSIIDILTSFSLKLNHFYIMLRIVRKICPSDCKHRLDIHNRTGQPGWWFHPLVVHLLSIYYYFHHVNLYRGWRSNPFNSNRLQDNLIIVNSEVTLLILQYSPTYCLILELVDNLGVPKPPTNSIIKLFRVKLSI